MIRYQYSPVAIARLFAVSYLSPHPLPGTKGVRA